MRNFFYIIENVARAFTLALAHEFTLAFALAHRTATLHARALTFALAHEFTLARALALRTATSVFRRQKWERNYLNSGIWDSYEPLVMGLKMPIYR